MRGKKGFLYIITLCCVMFSSAIGRAAPLTQAQYDLLKTDITVTHQAEFSQAVTNADYQLLADAYNLPASSPFWVWRTSLHEQEIYEATVEGTTWNWATYKSQTVQDRDSWRAMFSPGVVNPSLPNTRAGWTSIFGGQGASATQVTYLLTLARRLALRGEAVLANTSAGIGSTAAPATLTFEGALKYSDIAHALAGAP